MTRWVPVVALGVLTLALVVVGVLQVREHRDLAAAAAAEEQAVQLAHDQVEGLITIDPDNVSTRLSDLERRMTGDFLTQFRGMVDTFGSVVTQGKVTSSGEVVGAGLERISSDRAVVLVAASSQVRSTSSKGEPVERDYRFRVTLERPDGEWLVSDMDFVG